MIKKYLTKIIRNIQRRKEDSKAVLLGDDYSLQQVAKMWDDCSGHLHLISAHIMLDKISKSKIGSEDFEHYKQGITDFLNFLYECNLEVYNKTNK